MKYEERKGWGPIFKIISSSFKDRHERLIKYIDKAGEITEMAEDVQTYNDIQDSTKNYPFYYVKLKEKQIQQIYENEMKKNPPAKRPSMLGKKGTLRSHKLSMVHNNPKSPKFKSPGSPGIRHRAKKSIDADKPVISNLH
jgi:hypothetical protein